VRALLGHKGIETTQLYAQIRPAALKEAVSFYEAKAFDNINEIEMVAPTGFGSRTCSLHCCAFHLFVRSAHAARRRYS
jgi:hypothetical protein